jgi:DNA-binding MarR family transcriptional regulator
MWYTYNMNRCGVLDNLLLDLRRELEHPEWRRRLLEGTSHGLAVADIRVLRAVDRAERRGAAPSVGDVAVDNAVEHSTASRAVARVIDAGMLAKTTSAADQRRCELTLTERGREALDQNGQRRREMTSELVTDWTPEDLDMLATQLERLVADLKRVNG